jgi:hypothetical protein
LAKHEQSITKKVYTDGSDQPLNKEDELTHFTEQVIKNFVSNEVIRLL